MSKRINTVMEVHKLFITYAQYHTYCYVCNELDLKPISFTEFLLRKQEGEE